MRYEIEKTRNFAMPAPGSKRTGLSTDGPFRCDNCEYYASESCGNKDVMEDPQLVQLKLGNGRIAVRGEWCCNHFERD